VTQDDFREAVLTGLVAHHLDTAPESLAIRRSPTGKFNDTCFVWSNQKFSKSVASDRSIVAASRNHSDYLLFLLAPSIANGYTRSSSQTMLPQTL
jgi:hypothetical protein